MDGLTDTLENLGLAQEIAKGLHPSLQKPPKWGELAGPIAAMEEKMGSADPMSVYKTTLGEYAIREFAIANGVNLSMGRRKSAATAAEAESADVTSDGLGANWDDFKASNYFKVMCKYLALKDKVATETVEEKLFHDCRPLGKGAFGLVSLVFKKDTAAPMATKKMVKVIAKKNHMLKDVLIEREVLAKVKSKFCVNIHYAYHDSKEVALVITLCPGGDLGFLLQKQYGENKSKEFQPLPEGAVKYYAASMALGLSAVHNCGYVYRDLKPQNVLLDIDGLVRLSDMGLTADISKGAIKQCSGTRGYWSPETIKKEPYTTEPDWWSLGVTMYVLQSDKLPFKGKEDAEKDAATCSGEIEYSHGEPPDLQKVISDFCTIDQKARLCGIDAIKAHPYFAGFNWKLLEAGRLPPPIKPNPNDINAPDKKDIAAFQAPKDITWDPDDEAKFASWTMMDKDLWDNEAIFKIKNKKEFGGGGGGGGCCTVS